MASTFTTNLRIEKPADGEKDTTWGQVINANITEMFEDAISAESSISTTGGTTVLTTNNATADESRNVFLDISGTLVSTATITIPDLNKFYLVRNGTTEAFDVIIKPSGTGYTIVQGESAIVYCDGTDCFEIGMGGFTITTFAKTLLDDTSAGDVMTTLGITAYAQTILDDANALTARSTLGFNTGSVVQTLGGTIAGATGTTTIPFDDTSPLVSEGTQLFLQSITPSVSGNDVVVDFSVTVSHGTDLSRVIISVFRDSTCIGVVFGKSSDADGEFVLSFHATDVLTTTSTLNYSARIGVNAGTWHCNATGAGARFNAELVKNGWTLQEIST